MAKATRVFQIFSRFTMGLIVLAALAPAAFAQSLTNPNFDTDVSGWTAQTNTTLVWDALNQGGGTSGSALVTNTTPAATTSASGAFQCVPVTGGFQYTLGGWILAPAGQAPRGKGAMRLTWFTGTDCTGLISSNSSASTKNANWKNKIVIATAPPNAQSVAATLLVLKTGAGNFRAHFDNITLTGIPGRLQFSTAGYSISEAGGSALITVTRAGGSVGSVTVNYTASNGTAISPADYGPAAGTLIFPAGILTQTFSIPIVDDPVLEGDETINLTLSNPTGGATLGTPNTSVLTIVDNDVNLPGTLTLSTVTYSLAENGGSAVVTVNRTNGTVGDVTVDYATSDGTANSSDYTSTSGTLTFPNGSTSQTFSIPVTDDPFVEPDETVNITLSNPTGGAILGSPSSATLTIANDDLDHGSFQFTAATYSDGETAGTAAILVDRIRASNGDVTVQFATSDGSATAGSDYTAANDTLFFLDGDTQETVLLPIIIDDAAYEGDETVNLALSGPTGGADLGSPASAVLTIVDNEVAIPGTLQFGSATYSASENGFLVTLTINRTVGSNGAVTVDYATSDGTATAGSDYVDTFGTLSFADGETSKTVNVFVFDDLSVEGAEDFTMALGGATGGALLGTPSSATVTLTDNDLAAGSLQFSASSYTVSETAITATITVTRTGGTAGVVGVSYATSNVTAVEPGDYTAASGTLSFADGDASETFTVTVANDGIVEGNESLLLNLSSPTGNAVLGSPSGAALVITDSSSTAVGVLQFSAASFGVNETAGNGVISVSRTGGSFGVVSVDYATAAGTATVAKDYVQTSGTLVFASGEIEKTFTVTIADDLTVEGNETILASISNAVGTTLQSPTAATLNIIDNDNPAGNIQMAAPQSLVNESGTSINIVVRRVDGSAGAVSATFSVTAGTATAGVDYSAPVSTTLDWADGDMTDRNILISVTDDSIVESAETCSVALTTTTLAGMGFPFSTTLTITDNDVANAIPTITAAAGTSLQQGLFSNGVTIATVADAETPEASLGVTASAPSGVTVSNITVAADGTVTADISLNCTPAPGVNLISLQVTDGAGATANDSYSLTVNTVPVPLITRSTRYPVVNATGLTASVPSTGGTFNWTLVNGSNMTGQATNAITFDGGAPGTTMTIQVVETSPQGCAAPVATTKMQVDFLDVAPTNIFHDFVNNIAFAQVTLGCSAGNYCPNSSVTRLQMAAFIARSLAGSEAAIPLSGTVGATAYSCTAGGSSLFTDVAPTNAFCKYVHYIAANNVTQGCTTTTYCPNDTVSRIQMAIFVARAVAGNDSLVPSVYGPDPVTGLSYNIGTGQVNFTDLTGSPFSRHAHYLWARGIINGCGTGTTYCPTPAVTRLQMAKFLANAFNLLGP